MKLTESMIRDLVTTSKSAEEIADLLTMTGFELEEITVVEGEKVLDINVMANRGDGASSIGLAREILAKDVGSTPTELTQKLQAGNVAGDEGNEAVSRLAKVAIETEYCTRYACRVFEGLTNGPSPDWVQERLRKIGQRPISLLVDLTNYVMFETGQPLHAFDLDRIKGSQIIVRSAHDGEPMTTLDGKEHKLKSGQMMICDAERPVAVAGVMGGSDTEVSHSTTRCLLESAHFDHRSVRKTRKELGLQTDASYRFERYCDPEGVVRALNRFADLLRAAGGPDPVPGVIDCYPVKPVRDTVTVRRERVCHLLGMDVSSDEIERYLKLLGNRLERSGDTFRVTPPTWRIDLVREDDYVEEVGRVHGYEKIPEAAPIGSTPVGGAHGLEAMADRVREEALRCGFSQMWSHSLRELHPLDRRTGRVQVRSAPSPEIANLRNSLLPCLSDAALRNGGKDLHIYETGKVFEAGRESLQLALLSTGSLDGLHWNQSSSERADFFSMKGTVEALARAASACVEVGPLQPVDPRFHPTRQAAIGDVGVFGQIHPAIAEETGLPQETFLAEIDLDDLYKKRSESLHFRAVHRHPAARRDIAVVLDKTVLYRDVERAIQSACGDALERQWLFDVYEGKGIEPGHHSLAIALQFRKAGNFTDEEANQVRDAVVAALAELGARLR